MSMTISVRTVKKDTPLKDKRNGTTVKKDSIIFHVWLVG